MMQKPTVIISNNGEVIEREMNDKEYAQYLQDQQPDVNEESIRLKIIDDENTAKKIAAEAKLAALGLTAEDLKALGL